MSDLQTRMRFLLVRLVVIAAVGIIASRLWQLQIVASPQYQQRADVNRFRLVPIDAPRGIMYDRYGRQLVRNIPSYAVSVVPAGLPEDAGERHRVLARLGLLLGMPAESAVPPTVGVTATTTAGSTAPATAAQGSSIARLIEQRTGGPHTPVRIATNVDRLVAFTVKEEQLDLPGVLAEELPLRQYLDGPLMAHLLGYVGPIPGDALKDYLNDRGYTYQADDLVGLTGVEYSQEALLRGTKGEKHTEVDTFEREVRVIASSDAIAGHNLMLTIDLELQRFVGEALRTGMQRAKSATGAAIVIDPRTGEVLAMVSLPSYDNNLFSGGISRADLERLSTDPHLPLVNYAISGQYPPGSTFKIVTASAGLQEGVIGRSTTRHCAGTLLLSNKYFPDDWSKAQPFYCWARGGHGSLNVVGALAQSCDIFFYQVAGGYTDFDGLGIERLGRYARMLGYGEPTGVDLPGEAAGLVPTDRWKREKIQEPWLMGDTYNAGIGQGFVLATPLQVLNATAAVANGGTLLRPQLVYRALDAENRVAKSLAPEPIRKLALSPANLELVRRGLRDAVAQGTAPGARLPEISVAGKTGTAEYVVFDAKGQLIRDKFGHLPTHAWFTCFAPYEDPEIALVVFLAGGGEGSQTAVPVAASILRYYFRVPQPAPKPTAIPPTPTVAPTQMP